jgi:apolipoprotein N-acyltransferase
VSLKISKYSTINNITTGFFIALLNSLFLYLDWFGFVNYFINTIAGLLSFYLLLQYDKKVWFWFGFFMSALWFWWISISFKNYGFAWAIPIGILLTSIIFAMLFAILAATSEYLSQKISMYHQSLSLLLLKATVLLIFSYIHPLGFDWYKPELVFTNSYLGIEKWQFLIILIVMVLSIYSKKIYLLTFVIFAYPYDMHFKQIPELQKNMYLTNFNINVQDKWNPNLQQFHINHVFMKIDQAIREKKSLIVLPESIFALFLNKQPLLMKGLLARSKHISIVLGSLYMDGEIPRNSTYVFNDGNYTLANKVVLVPFGESNPLPSFLGDLLNKIFFDGAPDYFAGSKPTDYILNKTTFRNAICYEACSEELYEGKPENMIVISNNGWVANSLEPTEQKILLQYYSKKYGTTIYHSVNMSPSYIVHQGKVIEVQ